MSPNLGTTPSPNPSRLGPETKVFGIGLNKTATSSLKRSWELLGITPIPSQAAVAQAGLVNAVLIDRDYESALTFAQDYRAMEDRPWNVGDMYRRLHERFDDSVFILTVRDEESWWRSVHHWITVEKPHVQERYKLHLEIEEVSQNAFIGAYRRYNAVVTQYFEVNDPERFLVLDIGRGGEWENLCSFLGKRVPAVPFPHTNRQRYDGTVRRKKSATAHAEKLRLRHCVQCDDLLEKNPASAKPDASPKDSNLIVRSWRAQLERHRANASRRLIHRERRRSQRGKTLREVRAANPNLTIEDFGVVSCYFNPTGSRRRLRNYLKFADGLRRSGVPLITTELAIDDRPHHLSDEWGEVIQVRSSSVMWHKERLLNLAIERTLERGYQKIAWLDADIEFIDDDWAWHVAAELETSNLCQVFGRVLVHKEAASVKLGVGSVKYFMDRDRLDPQKRKRRKVLRPRYPSGYSGYGWAARADVLSVVPLYDSAVIGGGDKLIYLASLAQHETAGRAIDHWFESKNPSCLRCGHLNVAGRWHAHYLDWVKRWNDVVEGKVGYADTLIQDFYHGSRKNRLYRDRKEILLRQTFDPAEDLSVNSDGCLEWASDKPRLHEDLRLYFRQRTDR